MPPPSLLSLLPAASVSPGSHRAARRRPPTASRLPVRGARAASPLHASSSGGGEGGGGDELHLLEKPFPSPSPADEDEAESTEAAPALSTEEALAPFLKFFQGKSTEPDEDDAAAEGGGGGGYVEEDEEDKGEGSAGAGAGGRGVVYYDPKPGDLAVGVVVGADGRTLDIDVGAGGEPALMLAKEAVPMTGEEFEYLACDVASKDAAQFAAKGKVGVVVSGGERQGEVTGWRNGKGRGRGSPVLGVGTVVFTEVLGPTLGGRPLLSARRLFRRVAWHRVRQGLDMMQYQSQSQILQTNPGAGGRGVVYYDPKPGDLAVGVVVGADGRTLDIDVGAGGEPALMLAKEAVPMTGEEFEYLACDVASKDAAQFAAKGKVGVVVSGGERQGEVTGWRNGKGRGRGSPVLGVGTVVFTEVLGPTLGGRPLLSARRLFRRVAWHRVRQIKQLNVPIKVKIFEWNAGGLLTRIEGLRAFLPKPEMMTRPRNFTDLKNTVGQQIHVCITRIDEKANELIISEKEAWAMTYLREGTLLQGTVRKLFPYGAQITIGDTNRGGLLHVSNITHGQLTSVGDVLKVGEEVKAIVIKSTAPGRIALSTKDLESEPGLFLSNKEKVFSEAEEMAKRYRDQISETHQPAELDSSFDEVAPFDDEAVSYANWRWLRFSKSDKTNFNPRAESGL
uniref:S1 motif domain-containing protein n=1 Tax=Oryza meridionalis TaxID=40149 RepID=A0A0E0C763_9ORYZ